MKRFFVSTMMLFVAVATMTLTSCQKDEELILGKWNTETAKFTLQDGTEDPTISAMAEMFSGFEFVEGGTGTAFVNLGTETPLEMPCTWTLADETLAIILPLGEDSINLTLAVEELSKKQLIISGDNDLLGLPLSMYFEMAKAE